MKKLKIKILVFNLVVAAFLNYCFAGEKVPVPGITQGSIMLNVQYKQGKQGDTLTLVLLNNLYQVPENHNLGEYHAIYQPDGWFRFIIPTKSKSGFWSIYKTRTFTKKGLSSNSYFLLHNTFWETGDEVNITLSNKETFAGVHSSCSFSGRDSLKYKIQNDIDSMINHRGTMKNLGFDNNYKYIGGNDESIKNELALLDLGKGKTSPLFYQTMRSNIYFNGFIDIWAYYNENVVSKSDSIKNIFKQNYKSVLDTINHYGIPENILGNSSSFLKFSYEKYWQESFLITGNFDPTWTYYEIKKRESGYLRDRLIIYFLLNAPHLPRELKTIYEDAATFINSPECISVLNELSKNITGKKLDNFSFPDVKNKIVNLRDFKGKNVVLDFWFNGCAYCAVFYKNTLSKIEQKFKGDPTISFISINGDVSKIKWIKGIESGLYTSPQANNIYTEGKGTKHPFLINNNIGSFPVVIILDKYGVIKYFNSENLYNYDGLFAAIQSLK